MGDISEEVASVVEEVVEEVQPEQSPGRFEELLQQQEEEKDVVMPPKLQTRMPRREINLLHVLPSRSHEVPLDLTVEDFATLHETPVMVKAKHTSALRVPTEALPNQSPPKRRRLNVFEEYQQVPAGLLKSMTAEDLANTALRMTERGHEDRTSWPMNAFARVYKRCGKNDRILEYLRHKELANKAERQFVDRMGEEKDEDSSDGGVEPEVDDWAPWIGGEAEDDRFQMSM